MPRKAVLLMDNIGHALGFNEAGAVMPRKEGEVQDDLSRYDRLQ